MKSIENTLETYSKGQELMYSILSKCWEDESFKKELLDNPKVAIEKLTGATLNLPEDKNIVVVDQSNSPKKIFFNIPAEPEINLEELELTDEQLEMVAGGISPAAVLSSGACLSGAVWAAGAIVGFLAAQ